MEQNYIILCLEHKTPNVTNILNIDISLQSKYDSIKTNVCILVAHVLPIYM